MNRNKDDKGTVDKFFEVVARKGWSQYEAAEAVGLSQGWVSMAYRGEVRRLSMKARNRINNFLGSAR